MDGRDRPSGSTGIQFPKTASGTRNTRAAQESRGASGNRGPTRLVFVPVERRTYVPVPVPVDRIRGAAAATAAPLQTPLGKVAPIWIPDNQALSCMGCGVSFGFAKRRHHCRACGKVFCGNCSDLKSKLDYLDFKEARVCGRCHEQLTQGGHFT